MIRYCWPCLIHMSLHALLPVCPLSRVLPVMFDKHVPPCLAAWLSRKFLSCYRLWYVFCLLLPIMLKNMVYLWSSTSYLAKECGILLSSTSYHATLYGFFCLSLPIMLKYMVCLLSSTSYHAKEYGMSFLTQVISSLCEFLLCIFVTLYICPWCSLH